MGWEGRGGEGRGRGGGEMGRSLLRMHLCKRFSDCSRTEPVCPPALSPAHSSLTTSLEVRGCSVTHAVTRW